MDIAYARSEWVPESADCIDVKPGESPVAPPRAFGISAEPDAGPLFVTDLR